MSRLGRLFALVLALLIAAPTAAAPPAVRAADILNVPGDFSTIQAAIDAAVAGDTVLVGPGTYTERPVISKDITVESSDGPQTTFIDGNLAGTVVTVDAEAAETPVLRGFTIRRGNHSIWAGIRITGDALIEDNVITESCDGYAVVAGNSSATIRENVISGNGTPGCGSDGGLSIGGSGVQVLDNVIADNTGVGIHLNGAQTSLIARNVIRDNGGGTGGGIEMINAPNPVIVNNLITGNAGVLGPGIYWNSSEAGTVIANNTIVNNTVLPGANLPSSGVYVQGVTLAFVFANNIIASSHDKPALYCAGDFGGNAPPPSHNDIWNSVGSAVEGVCLGLVGTDSNVSIDPKFADPGVGDFHLRPDSPLIDAGREANAPSDDFDGDARPHDGDENGTAAVDIGFDEAVDPVLIEPSSVDFGEVVEDVPSTAEVVTLENFGDAPLSVTGVAISGDDAADFTVTDETCTDGPIAASATCDVTVVFTPSAIGEHDASLSISGPDPVGTRTIALTGAGLDSIVVEPADVAAPATSIGTTATAGTVMVTNRGGSAATVTSVSIGGTNAADFTVSNQTCTAGPIATDDDCTISIQFGPKAVGSRSATLTIQGPAPVGTRNVSLAGTGEAPPSGITWGSVSSAGPSSYTWNAGGACTWRMPRTGWAASGRRIRARTPACTTCAAATEPAGRRRSASTLRRSMRSGSVSRPRARACTRSG